MSKQYNNWRIVSYGSAAILFLHVIGRYIGIGINLTDSAPRGIYTYYPLRGRLKVGDIVDFSLTKQQRQLAHNCIARNQYGLKKIGARPGERLLSRGKKIYACSPTTEKKCRRLGVCLSTDHFGKALKCQKWPVKRGYKIPPHQFYLRSIATKTEKHGCDSRYFGLITDKHIYHRLSYKNRRLALFLSFCLSVCSHAFASLKLPAPAYSLAERGYWFYQTTTGSQARASLTPRQCKNTKHWEVDCGFIDPSTLHLAGKSAYRFEQKQYHALLNDYALRPNNLTAVLHWQQFNRWVIRQSMTAAYAMQFTLSQHPELNDALTHPFSQFGNLVLRHIENKNRKTLFHWLAKSSFLVFFSRSNCPYCHAQAPIISMLSHDTGISVWNASLDRSSLPLFSHHLNSPTTLHPAKLLKVRSVPTLFLYLSRKSLSPEQKQGGVWLRLATGLTAEKTIEKRLVHFVLAYRQALIDGIHNGQLQPDFSHSNLHGLATNDL